MQTSLHITNYFHQTLPLNLGAASSDARPVFLRDGYNTFAMSDVALAAREHCIWAYEAGETPKDVLKSVGRPHNLNSTWQDAARAIESASYSAKFEETRQEYIRMLSCL